MSVQAVPLSLTYIEKYKSGKGIAGFEKVPFEEKLAIECADYYDEMSVNTDLPEVVHSYEVFTEHLIAQFRLMQDAGFEFIDGKGEHEYSSSDALRDDMRQGRIIYLPTVSNQGTQSEIAPWHPFAQEVFIGDRYWIVNDIFRIVHDFYGHGPGHGFSPHGEHDAWLSHRSILPKEARIALFCETRGQSSWVNFGKHIRNSPVFIAPFERPFAPQKIGFVPEELI